MFQRLRFLLALYISKLASIFIDIIAKGRGTNLPGMIALKIDPRFLAHFRGVDPKKTVLITGTNGKSTTTNLLNRVLKESGKKVVSNLDGANMTPGVAVAMLRGSSWTGRIDCDYLVMETDERYVSRVREQLPAKYLCVTNIQKDQVQRNGEPGFIYTKIRQAIASDMTVFVNHDDPNAALVASGAADAVISYGAEKNERSFVKENDFFAVSMRCPRCHGALDFSHYNFDHVGQYHCPLCGLSNESQAAYSARDISFQEEHFTLCGEVYPFHYALPQFLYSYLAAAAVALEFGIAPQSIRNAFDGFCGISNRVTTVLAGTHPIDFLKYKQENSETLQMIVSIIANDKREKNVIFGLDEYIDFYPPYLNTCFLYDADLRPLQESGIRRWATTSKGLGHSAAVRMLYDGFDENNMLILPDSEAKTLASALDGAECETSYLVEEIPFFQKRGRQK